MPGKQLSAQGGCSLPLRRAFTDLRLHYRHPWLLLPLPGSTLPLSLTSLLSIQQRSAGHMQSAGTLDILAGSIKAPGTREEKIFW